jgi:hypothetical protein
MTDGSRRSYGERSWRAHVISDARTLQLRNSGCCPAVPCKLRPVSPGTTGNAGSPAKISQRVSVASTIVIESKIRVFQHNPSRPDVVTPPSMSLVWTIKKELANRPLVREQAFGESLDPDKLERLGRYKVHLDRSSNGRWPCSCALRTWGRGRWRADPFRKTNGGRLMHAPGDPREEVPEARLTAEMANNDFIRRFLPEGFVMRA